MIKVKIINKSKHPLPAYATNGSAGFDIRASIVEKNDTGEYSIVLHPKQIKAIETDLYFQLPEGTELQIRSRSGMAIKSGVVVLNSPGTLDSDYTGELKIILINHSDSIFIIKDGDRIAQGILAKHEQAEFVEVEQLEETERGSGGFGHTGKS